MSRTPLFRSRAPRGDYGVVLKVIDLCEHEIDRDAAVRERSVTRAQRRGRSLADPEQVAVTFRKPFRKRSAAYRG